MKKVLKIIGMISGAVFLIATLILAFTYFTNKSDLKIEAKLIAPYGEMVKVNGGRMNVTVSGNGDENIVILPGFMTAAPKLDFTQLTEELEKNYKVIVVEPLGYGMSDDTDKPRTVENINEELHEALEKINVSKYNLMAHSISGVYSLSYINKYPNEVTGFIGIDSSLPSQGEAGDNQEETVRFLSKSGLFRILGKADESLFNIPKLSAEKSEQFKYVYLRSLGSKAMTDEGKKMPENFEKAIDLKYLKDFPVMYFLATESTESDPNWEKIHQDMIKDNPNGEIKVLKGDHYLHHTKFKEISSEVDSFLKK